MVLDLKEYFITVLPLKRLLKQPYQSLPETGSRIRQFRQHFLQNTANLKKVLSTVDLSGFNPTLGLEDELVIPEMAYSTGKQGEQQGPPRRLKIPKSPGKDFMSLEHDGPLFPLYLIIFNYFLGGGGWVFFSKTAPAPRRRHPAARGPSKGKANFKEDQKKVKAPGALMEKLLQSVSQEWNRLKPGFIPNSRKKELLTTLESLTQKRNRQDIEKMNGIDKPVHPPDDNHHDTARARYIKKLAEKRNKVDNHLLFDIFHSAFTQIIQGQDEFSAKANQSKDFPEMQEITKGIKSFEAEVTDHKVHHNLEEPGFNSNLRGFQLLEILTQTRDVKSHQIITKDNSVRSTASTIPKSSTPVPGTGKTVPMAGSEDIKNFINLTVQMQAQVNGSDNGDLETLGEKVNRILIEQARRYGIDLT